MPENQLFPRDEHGRRMPIFNESSQNFRWWEPKDPELEEEHHQQKLKYLEEAKRWILGQPDSDA